MKGLFKGLLADSRAAKAGFDAAEANYRETVLHAFQNVADVLRYIKPWEVVRCFLTMPI